jgi:hypothetical protein
VGVLDRLFARRDEPPTGAAGVDGANYYEEDWLGGPDINPELTGKAKYEVYREMWLTDPAVRSVEFMYKLPIRRATWTLEAASEEPDDARIRDCVADQFGLGTHSVGFLDQTWDESLGQALLYLRWGSMFEEIVWGEATQWQWEGDAEPLTIRPIVQLGPRSPGSIEEIKVEAGRLSWIKQDLPGANRIPGDKLAYYIFEREGGSWWGTSLYRAMYGPWRLKKALMVAAGVGWDRFSAGTPKVRYPKGGGEAARRQANEIGRSLRLHERGYVTLEGSSIDATGGGGWDVEIMSGAHTLADPVPLLRTYDEQIALAGLQGFTRLGVTETGSRAVGEVLADPYYLAMEAIADDIADKRTQQIVRRFVDVNFGEQYEVPKLTASDITSTSVETLVDIIATLAPLGISLATPGVIEQIKDRLDIPIEEEPVEGAPAQEGESVVPEPAPESEGE